MKRFNRLVLRSFCMSVPLTVIAKMGLNVETWSVESFIVGTAIWFLVLGFNATFIYKEEKAE